MSIHIGTGRLSRRLLPVLLAGLVLPFDGVRSPERAIAASALPASAVVGLRAAAPVLPGDIARGPDGNLWFTLVGRNRVGRITPRGRITLFPIPTPRSGPLRIATGPDGNVWFTENAGNRIGRVTPGGRVAEFALPRPGSRPLGITAGPDGNVWFVEGGARRVGRITPRGRVAEFALPPARGNLQVRDIAAGRDGNLWFADGRKDCCSADRTRGRIGRITPSGLVAEYTVPTDYANPMTIVAGPDGNLWFTETVTNVDQIGRVTPAGRISQYQVPTALVDLWGLTPGPDGNLWYTRPGAGVIGRVTPRGAITEVPLSLRQTGVTNGPTDVVTGLDGALWFMELTEGRIGRATLAGRVTEYAIPSCCLAMRLPIVGQLTEAASHADDRGYAGFSRQRHLTKGDSIDEAPVEPIARRPVDSDRKPDRPEDHAVRDVQRPPVRPARRLHLRGRRRRQQRTSGHAHRHDRDAGHRAGRLA